MVVCSFIFHIQTWQFYLFSSYFVQENKPEIISWCDQTCWPADCADDDSHECCWILSARIFTFDHRFNLSHRFGKKNCDCIFQVVTLLQTHKPAKAHTHTDSWGEYNTNPLLELVTSSVFPQNVRVLLWIKALNVASYSCLQELDKRWSSCTISSCSFSSDSHDNWGITSLKKKKKNKVVKY